MGSHQLVTDLLWGNWCNGFWPLLTIDILVHDGYMQCIMLNHIHTSATNK